jgi:hypothetical protein
MTYIYSLDSLFLGNLRYYNKYTETIVYNTSIYDGYCENSNEKNQNKIRKCKMLLLHGQKRNGFKTEDIIETLRGFSYV